MSDPLERKREQRALYLKALYKRTNGSERVIVDRYELGGELGFDVGTTDDVVDYLRGEGFVKSMSLGGDISITHRGIVEVEENMF
jgi:hypothetical protein